MLCSKTTTKTTKRKHQKRKKKTSRIRIFDAHSHFLNLSRWCACGHKLLKYSKPSNFVSPSPVPLVLVTEALYVYVCSVQSTKTWMWCGGHAIGIVWHWQQTNLHLNTLINLVVLAVCFLEHVFSSLSLSLTLCLSPPLTLKHLVARILTSSTHSFVCSFDIDGGRSR